MFGCANNPNGWVYPPIEELYSPSRGSWRTFDISVAEQHCGQQDPYYCYFHPGPVGAHWQEFSITLNGIPMSPTRIGWENLDTHAWKQTGSGDGWIPGLGPTTMLDLNSRSLLAPVCRPIELPSKGRLIQTRQGVRSPIQMVGRFAVLNDPYYDSGFPRYEPDHAYLQRCGHRRRHTLSPAQAGGAGNGQVLIWGKDSSQLAGMHLASGKRFVASLATPAPGGAEVDITTRDVLQVSPSGLWDAPLPKSASYGPAPATK
jgi:hypothetical protein